MLPLKYRKEKRSGPDPPMGPFIILIVQDMVYYDYDNHGVRMNKHWLFVAFLASLIIGTMLLAAGAQDVKALSPPSINVRVRVSAGGQFVGDLTLQDFKVLEDGRLQSTTSLSLVRGGQIVRREGEELSRRGSSDHTPSSFRLWIGIRSLLKQLIICSPRSLSRGIP